MTGDVDGGMITTLLTRCLFPVVVSYVVVSTVTTVVSLHCILIDVVMMKRILVKKFQTVVRTVVWKLMSRSCQTSEHIAVNASYCAILSFGFAKRNRRSISDIFDIYGNWLDFKVSEISMGVFDSSKATRCSKDDLV